jgi:hypothetical protein
MPLSLESIHKPLNDFFLNQFGTAGSSVLFRFDKIGSVVSDEDFIDPNHPELGYSHGVAVEKFSDLVNHIPNDQGDGMNIVLSADSIDTTYFFRLLTPASPFLPDSANDATKEAIIEAFGAIKNDANKVYNNVKLESSTGLMMEYKPALATPDNWYDKTKSEVWTHQSFQVSEASSPPATSPGTSPSNQLWRMKVNDVGMQQTLQLSEVTPQVNIPARMLEVHAQQFAVASPALAMRPSPQVASFAPMMMMARPMAMMQPQASVAAVAVGRASAGPAAAPSFALHDNLMLQTRSLNVSNRLMVMTAVQNIAPTQPVETSSVTISFDYSVVKIRRPWYVDVFINDRSWCLPAMAKGQITASGTPGNLPLMPIAFVAIRNLSIEADWSAEDMASAASATNFGPFKVTSVIASNKLTHQGLQVVGWLMQKMPDLPPN